MAAVQHRGAYSMDDPPVVPRGSKEVTAPGSVKQVRREAPTKDNVPRVVGTPSLPHATPAPVPQTYSQQQRYGPSQSFGGGNIVGQASAATPFQLALGAAALFVVATKLSGK
jgi:hypothetical protein